MDLSKYHEQAHEARVKELLKNVEEKTDGGIIELTEEEIQRAFWNFTDNKEFKGTFKGIGQVYKLGDVIMNTWAFIDDNGLNWLIPQWQSMADFEKETPEEKHYYIRYNDFIDEGNGNSRHDLTIFSKKL